MIDRKKANTSFWADAFLLIIALVAPGCETGPRGSIIVDPPDVKLMDRTYPENEYVSAGFRILNPFDKKVTVTDVATSCGCTKAIFGEGKSPPLTIAPNGALEFKVMAFGTSKPVPVQTFFVNISSKCDGLLLPDVRATLRFRVEDSLKAFPRNIVAAGLPLGPAKFGISLVTRSAATIVPTVQLKVSDPEFIKVRLNPAPADIVDVEGFEARYTADVTVTPKPGASTVTGLISVIADGRAIQQIPIECAFRTPYYLSLREVTVEGAPGDRLYKEIFYEAHDLEWRDIDVVDKPDNVGVEVGQFGLTTQRLRLTIQVPAVSKHPGEKTHQECVVLKSKRGNHELKVPIRYDVSRATSIHSG